MDKSQTVIHYSTVSDSVYSWIKNAIIQGEFKPGEHITQERLTKQLGVSRTPIRDAIKRLEAEGLLITKPHCGAVVFHLSQERLTEIYELRIIMEQYCAARTCLKASDTELLELEAINLDMLNHINDPQAFMQLDRKFHYQLCALSGCTNTMEILDGLWDKSDSFKSIYYALEGRANDTLTEHAHIIQSLKNRDVAGTKLAIENHLKDVVTSIDTQMLSGDSDLK